MTPAQIGAVTIPGTDTGTLAESATLITVHAGASDSLSLAETQTVSTGLSAGDVVSEHFATYSSTANMLADPRGIYIPSDDVNTAQIVLDKTVGDTASGLTQSCRLDYPARPQPGGCADYTITRSLAFPTDQTEIWIRTRVLWPATWTNDDSCGGASPPNKDFKFQFVGVRTAGRYNVMVGTFNVNYTVGYPGNEDGFEGGSVTEWDGTWHTYWFHCKNGSSGACAFAVDSTVIKDYGTPNTSGGGQLYKVTFPRNINQGPPVATSLWLGAIDVFSAKPSGSPV